MHYESNVKTHCFRYLFIPECEENVEGRLRHFGVACVDANRSASKTNAQWERPGLMNSFRRVSTPPWSR